MQTRRSQYLATLGAAMTQPARGEPPAALQAFLALNAGHFLGEWLPDELHERLVTRLARRLDGLADLSVPDDETAARQLAQHARELAATFGTTAWTERIVAATATLVPDHYPAHTKRMAAALRAVANGDDGGMLLRLHAEKRLWALTHPDGGEETADPVPDWALSLAVAVAESADGRAVQVAEAVLAELAYGA